jgi:hypothetical protein
LTVNDYLEELRQQLTTRGFRPVGLPGESICYRKRSWLDGEILAAVFAPSSTNSHEVTSDVSAAFDVARRIGRWWNPLSRVIVFVVFVYATVEEEQLRFLAGYEINAGTNVVMVGFVDLAQSRIITRDTAPNRPKLARFRAQLESWFSPRRED